MRKKSLRAMKSAVFQAPESRAEAIMQNILGANNVLVPPEAPFEEILQAILYNTPYTKEAESRIEEILLAIKNNGTYYGEPQSRDEEILISKLNQTPYTKDAESRIEELFILWAAQSVIKQLEGVPPLAFTAQGQPLINWTIYGASGGVGERTANLFDCNYVNAYVDAAQYKFVNVNTNAISAVIEVEPNTTYTVKKYDTSNRFLIGSAASVPTLNMPLSMINTDNEKTEVTFTTESSTNYIVVYVSTGAEHATPRLMLNIDSTALPYEPYGYKIPISCGGEINTIYLDTPLYGSNTISMADTGIEIPTTNGQNTLAVDTTVQPEKVYIEYK